jgi:hypothetical protein
MSDIYKSKEQITTELGSILNDPLTDLLVADRTTEVDSPELIDAYLAFMKILAGYYVRGTAEFYNAGVQAERKRNAKFDEISLCTRCHSMTHTRGGHCGECGAKKVQS